MPASNYPFLARNQKTEEERQKDNIDALWSQLGAMGISGGKNSFFTGYGEDNRFQANRPTAILNTNQGPKTVHEAERVDISPNGEFSVTPASQIGGQQNLQMMEKENNIQGYQSGTPDKQDSSIMDTYKPYTDRGLQRLERYADYESPVNKSIREGERERFAGEAASAKGALSQEMSQLGITGREAATEEARLDRQIGAQETQMMTDLRKQESQQAFTAAQQLPSQAATVRSMDIATQQWQKEFEFDKERYGDTQKWTDFEYTAQYGSDEDVVAAYRDATGKELDPSAVAEIRGYARTKRAQDVTSGYLGLLAQEYNISNTQMEAMAYAVEHGATRERLNSEFGMDFSEEEFARLSRNFDYEGGVQTATIDAMNIQNAAAQLGIDATRFKTFIDVVNSGGDLEAANMASGLRLSAGQWDDIRRDYSYEGKLQEENLTSAHTKVGDEVFDSIKSRIASGVPVETVNSEFNTNLTPEEYLAIRRTTDTGIREYERNVSAVGMLLQTGDPQNMIIAQNLLQTEVFPGVPLSIDQLVKDVGAERAAKGLTDLSTLASTFGSWEEAQASVERLGLLDNLNMAPEEAAKLFDSLKINALDEEWKAISESEFFQTLEPDKQQLIKDTLTAYFTGELEFDIQPVYNVTTADGGFVQSFSNVEDANEFISQNAGKNYSVNEAKNYIYKNLASGDTVVVNNVTGKSTTNPDGIITISDAWGNFQDSMENIPEAEQPSYTEWKTAWNEAGNPFTFTYDDYVKQRGKAGEGTIIGIADKYKNGWPNLTTKIGEMNANQRDYIYTEGQKNDVLEARKNFIASPENTMTISPDNARTKFSELAKDLQERQNDGSLYVLPSLVDPATGQKSGVAAISNMAGDTGGDDYRRSNLVSIEGYDSPFVMTGKIDYSSPGTTGSIKSIELINMSTGKIATLYEDGRLVEAQTSRVNS